MQLEGQVAIAAPRERVWKLLIDPEVVGQCAPGIQSMEVIVPDREFEAVAAVGFGAVKTTFKARVQLTKLDPPNHAEMRVDATAPGSVVEAISRMTLSNGADGATDLHWTADVKIMGTIANLASRMMGGLTKRLSTQFFDCVRARIEQ